MVRDSVSQDFIKLDLNNSIGDAIQKLREVYGVVLDAAGHIVSVITAEDLGKFAEKQTLSDVVGQLPPAIIMKADETMEAFVQSPPFAAFSLGVRGAIVEDAGEILGILTEKTIRRYLHDEFELTGEQKGIPSDNILPGSTTSDFSTGELLIMYCDEFKHRNELMYYNRHKPPECQVKEPYPHPIRRRV